MTLKDNTNLENCLKLVTESEELRDKAQELLQQAEIIEEKAVKNFRRARNSMIRSLQLKKKKLKEKLENLESKYFGLASTFCEQNGNHTFTYRKVITSWTPLYHSFKEGNVYPGETYSTCLICGKTNDPKLLFKSRGFYQAGSEEVIKKASEQNENFELKKTVQRIFEIREAFEIIQGKLEENSEGFKEICSLFGHDAEKVNQVYFKCKCCKKVMEAKEYADTYHNAKYKGWVVPYYYDV